MPSATPNSRGRQVSGSEHLTTAGAWRNRMKAVLTRFLPLLLALQYVTYAVNLFGGQADKGADGGITKDISMSQKAFHTARDRFQRESNSVEAAWQFGRACFDLAEEKTSKSEKGRLAEQGIEACKKAVVADENSAPAQYYLGMNLGQLARTKGIGALKLVGPMKRAFERALELDQHIDHAGPDRNLGMLYRDAPGWLVGDRQLAQAHLVKAVEVDPDFPDNRLELIEGYLKWGDRTSAQTDLTTLEDLWPKLRQKFSGPEWEGAWKAWQERLDAFQAKIEKGHKKSG
jgi:tetratricopeptide (TPR) repeat protein